MKKQHETHSASRPKTKDAAHPKEGTRKTDDAENTPQKTVGTKTPGLKKDEDMPVAAERKARSEGSKR